MRHQSGIAGFVLLAAAAVGQCAAGTLAPVGNIPHLAWGGGWQTVMFLSNTATSDAAIVVNFYDDNGTVIAVPWTNVFNGPADLTGTPVTALNFTLKAGALAVLKADSGAAIGSTAWAQVLSDVTTLKGGVDFKYASGAMNGEALVTYEEGKTQAWDLLFFSEKGAEGCDNSWEFTSYAIANTTSAPVTISLTVSDRISGQQKYQGTLSLPAHGHKAFPATDLVTQPNSGYGPPAGGVWMMRVSAPSAGQIAPLALHFRQNWSNCAKGQLIFESLPGWPIQ